MKPAWFPDPYSRYQYRWWDGFQWSSAVAHNGRTFVDVVGPASPAPARPAPVSPQSVQRPSPAGPSAPPTWNAARESAKAIGSAFKESATPVVDAARHKAIDQFKQSGWDGSIPDFIPTGGPSGVKGERIGLRSSGHLSAAPAETRLAARAIDGLIMLPWIAVACFIGYELIVAKAVHSLEHPSVSTAEGLFFGKLWREVSLGFEVTALLIVAGWLVYVSLLTHFRGATFGKAKMGLRIVTVAEKQNVPFHIVLARELVYVGLIAIPTIGWLVWLLNQASCLWDRSGRCWHDYVAHTVVVRYERESSA